MCGASRNEGAILEIDHIHPVSKGGTNDLSNLQVLCRDCNAGKGNEILSMP
jgi:5-methylcytosine-specific restriction endonuclease McrA